nr:serine proteinase (EC 3.4.21.-) 4 - nematode (Anisakis simplex) (fragments) [Anisakis simplex]
VTAAHCDLAPLADLTVGSQTVSVYGDSGGP